MQIKLPQPFFFEEGKRAVLLLHGFTGNSSDVRQLGDSYRRKATLLMRLNTKGIAPPEEILKSSPHVWFKDVLDGYDYLVDQGYEDIAVAGLSLGGVFALKLSLNRPVKGIVTMCAPAKVKRKVLYTKAFRICKKLQKYEGKDQATIDKEMEDFHPTETLKELSETLNNVRNEIDEVLDPILVVQENDEMINPQSTNYIYENVDSDEKDIKWYANSGHVITIDKEKNKYSKMYTVS